MSNERLRSAIAGAGMSVNQLGEQVGVDPKTVERWITRGRVPYSRHRAEVARALRQREAYLWPDATQAQRIPATTRAELVEVFPHRAMVTAEDYRRLFADAHRRIDILVYAALFLPEQNPILVRLLCERAADGVEVRVALGDPDCDAVAVRGREEGIGDAVSTKARNALTLLRQQIGSCSGVEVRIHRTTLYTSIYRGDDQMIVNPHVYGLPAAQAPAMHLKRLGDGGLFDTYSGLCERVWAETLPAWN